MDNYLNNIHCSDRNQVVTLLLCLFFGYLGIHRFYCGKVGTGILYLFTFGLFTIGWIVDIIVIACGKFRDSNGRLVKNK